MRTLLAPAARAAKTTPARAGSGRRRVHSGILCPRRQADDDDDGDQAGAQHRGQGDEAAPTAGRPSACPRCATVGCPPTRRYAGGGAHRDPDHDRDARRQQPDEQRDAAPPDDPAQDVAADVVEPERGDHDGGTPRMPGTPACTVRRENIGSNARTIRMRTNPSPIIPGR